MDTTESVSRGTKVLKNITKTITHEITFAEIMELRETSFAQLFIMTRYCINQKM